MTARHVPEPWTWTLDERADVFSESTGANVCRVHDVDGPDAEAREVECATAARIVACVNACAGVADPAAFIVEARALAVALRVIEQPQPGTPPHGWADVFHRVQAFASRARAAAPAVTGVTPYDTAPTPNVDVLDAAVGYAAADLDARFDQDEFEDGSEAQSHADMLLDRFYRARRVVDVLRRHGAAFEAWLAVHG